MKKPVLYFISIATLIICTIFFVGSNGVKAAIISMGSGICGDALTWEGSYEFDFENYVPVDDSRVLTIKGTGAMYDYTFNDPPWLSLMSNSNIDHIVIENGVESIQSIGLSEGSEVNTSIKTISIPESLIDLGQWTNTFRGLSALYSIKVDKNNPILSDVDGVLFDKNGTVLYLYPPAKKGDTYIVPNGIIDIWISAFENSSMLTDITLPNAIERLLTNAFASCENLANINLPNQLVYLGESVFAGCANIKSITIPASVTNIDMGAFGACGSLEEIHIKGSTNPIIGYEAFAGAGTLASTKRAYGDPSNTQLKAALEAKGYTWILPQVISVILPTDITFNVDPTKSTINQVTSPDIDIINNSNVAINLSVFNVVDTNGILAGSVTSTKEKALLAILPKGTALDSQSALESQALKSGVQSYNIVDIPADGGRATLNIFGQASDKGWKVTDSFKLTTTFKIVVI